MKSILPAHYMMQMMNGKEKIDDENKIKQTA